jgi:hypothetical protein
VCAPALSCRLLEERDIVLESELLVSAGVLIGSEEAVE